MASVFDYQFNIGGNFTAAMDGMAESAGHFNAAVKGTHDWLGKLSQALAIWDLASNYVGKFNDTIDTLSASGISLNRQMHGLSAIAGVTGADFKKQRNMLAKVPRLLGSVLQLLLKHVNCCLIDCPPNAIPPPKNSNLLILGMMGVARHIKLKAPFLFTIALLLLSDITQDCS